MKKILLVVFLMTTLTFSACGNKTKCKCTNDTTQVDTLDTTQVDTLDSIGQDPHCC